MSRTIVIIVGVVAVAAIVYFAMVDRTGMGTARGPAVEPVAPTTQAPPEGQAVTDENVSTRVAADVATEEAFEQARAGEEPVQDTVDTARAAAGQTGAVGGVEFTAEGYNRATVVEAIVQSDLPEAEKEQLVLQLDAAEPQPDLLEEALAEVRLALAL